MMRRDPHCWSAEELAYLREHYATTPAAAIAAHLGLPLHSVYQRAFRIGLRKGARPIMAEAVETIRLLHAQGLLDTEIARRTGLDRRTINDIRRNRLKLPVNDEARLEARRRGVVTQMRTLGIRHGGDLRRLAYQRYARENGWPEDLRPREVQILNALAARGPMTRLQLAAAIGTSTTKRNSVTGRPHLLSSNRKEGTYTATLLAMGLICRIERRTGKDRKPGLYLLTEKAISLLEVFHARQAAETGGRENRDAGGEDDRPIRRTVAPRCV